jgi:hypothetical protein
MGQENGGSDIPLSCVFLVAGVVMGYGPWRARFS